MQPSIIISPERYSKITWKKIKEFIPQKEFLRYNGSIQRVFNGCSCPINEIQINDEFRKTLGVTSKDEAIDAIIINALTKISENYLGGKTAKKENLKLCSSLVRRHFSHISVPEILLAFEMASIGVIEVDTNLYGNDFNVV